MKHEKNITILAISSLLLLIAILYLQFVQAVTPVPLKKPFLYFPFQIGDWKDKDKPGSDYLITALGADDILTREYEDGAGEKLELYFSYFDFTKEGKGPHAPQLCWVGSGWAFTGLGEERLNIGCKDCPEIVIRKILAQKPDKKILLFYCYKLNKRYISDFSKFKAATVLDSIIKRRSGSFTLQLSSQVGLEGVEGREKVMREFLLQVFPILERDFLP